MKKLFLIACVGLFITSCSELKSEDDRLNGLECPIIVIAKSPEVRVNNKLESYGSVTLSDKNGKTETFSSMYVTGSALVNSYEKGDTLLNFKK
jgi:hypothetical protein